MTDARLTVEPTTLPWTRAAGSVSVTWSGADSGPWEVRVRRDDRPEMLLASGPGGTQKVDWIVSGSVYQFRLYPPGGTGKVVAAVDVRMSPPADRPPFVVAYPNPLPEQAGPARATLAWDTGDGSDGVLVLVRRSESGEPEEVSIATGSYGSTVVDWIQPDHAFRFRLYRASDRDRPIGGTTITMRRSHRDTLIDVSVVTIGAGIIAGVCGIAALACRQLARTARSLSGRRR